MVSGYWIYVDVLDSVGIGNMGVKFSTTMQYWISWCTANGFFKDLPVQPPMDVENIWTIKKTSIAFIIICNNVEVLNYVFTDSSDSLCVPKWGGDVVERILFSKVGDASEFYRPGI